MRRSGFRRPTYERPPVVLTPIAPENRRGVMARVETVVRGVKPASSLTGGAVRGAKPVTYRSEAWRRAVASLPCIHCGREGQTQAAHPNHVGKGMGMKSSDAWCCPLCVTCHAEFDQGRRWSKDEKHALMDRWILETINELAVRGLVAPKGRG